MSVDSVREQNSLLSSVLAMGFPLMFNKNPVLVVKVGGSLRASERCKKPPSLIANYTWNDGVTINKGSVS